MGWAETIGPAQAAALSVLAGSAHAMLQCGGVSLACHKYIGHNYIGSK